MNFPFDLSSLIQTLAVATLPIIFAVTFHEAAHGFVASRLGDDTALRMGRVTFNPLKHIDPVGTIVLPLILLLGSQGQFIFGYAKPVPVRFDRLNHPRRDMVWVALAGPATNLLLAFVSALLAYTLPYVPLLMLNWTGKTIGYSLDVNIMLALFNMIPLPPLDGGRVAVGLLPDRLAIPLARSERYGMLILITLIFFLPMIGQGLHTDLNVLNYVLDYPFGVVKEFILRTTGLIA